MLFLSKAESQDSFLMFDGEPICLSRTAFPDGVLCELSMLLLAVQVRIWRESSVRDEEAEAVKQYTREKARAEEKTRAMMRNDPGRDGQVQPQACPAEPASSRLPCQLLRWQEVEQRCQ